MMADEILPPNERGYVDASILVTTDWLAEHINDSNVVVVDTDDPSEYAAGHIPGASNPPDNYYKTSLDDRTHIQGAEAVRGDDGIARHRRRFTRGRLRSGPVDYTRYV